MNYDLIVIGSGPAGEKGAAQAAYFGKRVALIEREPVPGGACVNTGTVPSKTLRESALHLSGFRLRGFSDSIGLSIRDDITVGDFMYRKDIVVAHEWQRIDENLENHRVRRFTGTARFMSPHRIEIASSEGTTEIEGEIILVATGSAPYRPAHIPFDDAAICDSDSILAMSRIPKTMAVVGAGVIGCEYASMFAALGVAVHLVDGRTSLLPHIDREIAAVLLDEMQSRLGVRLHLGVDVKSIEKHGSGVVLTLQNEQRIEVDTVLYAAGRSSNTASLNLEAAGVRTGNRGVIVVDEKYRTSAPNIYAAGDVIGFPALASTSMEQARVAMVHAFDLKYKPAMAETLPYGIYTIPEVSTIGLTEEQCCERKVDYECGRARFRNNARGRIVGDENGLIKLVFDAGNLRLLGVHIVGENASELLHTGMMVMHFEGTINAFIDSVFNFPTLGESYKYAAYDGLGRVARRG